MDRPPFCVVPSDAIDIICQGCGALKSEPCEATHGHSEGGSCPHFEMVLTDELPIHRSVRLMSTKRLFDVNFEAVATGDLERAKITRREIQRRAQG